MRTFLFCLIIGLAATANAQMPEKWETDWENPPATTRPLQIIHGNFYRGKPTISEGLETLRELGLGGIVTNVPRQNYLKGEKQWQDLVETVRQAKAKGLRVWIYDEDGYPSPQAGGLVLQENPALEAKELVYDPTQPEPFIVRDCFEYTHASNNYAKVMRYPSLVNPRVSEVFLRITHDAYRQHLGEELFDWVEAFFTDEPSTNALNTGQLPQKIRERVLKVDAMNPDKPNLPMVVWEDDFPEIYRQRYGEDLLSVRKSLFEGDSEADKKVRRQFWQMVAQRCCDGFYTPIRQWCERYGKASSGHTLWEESLLNHVPLDGDKLKVLKEMNIPGLDYLSSWPESVFKAGWKSTIFPASAAILNGDRLVFTEVSDHSQRMADPPQEVSVAWMNATAAWHLALGVTEFTLYYNPSRQSVEDYRQYCQFVGRANALIRDAAIRRDVLLYYPIRQMQEEYLPIAKRPTLQDMSEKLQQLQNSWNQLGEALLRTQQGFYAAGDEDFATALAFPKDHPCHVNAVVLPAGAVLAPEALAALEKWRQAGGKVYEGEIPQRETLLPACRNIVRGDFERDGWRIQMLCNISNEKYSGKWTDIQVGECELLYPADGRREKRKVGEDGLEIHLNGLESVLILQKTN